MRAKHLARPLTVLALAALVACGGSSRSSSSVDEPPGTPGGIPVQTFVAADGARFGVQVLLTNLQIPWAMAFAPDGRLFFTERPGRVRIYASGQLLAAPALVLPDVFTTGESGALGLALHPDFATNHLVYLTYTANGPRGHVGRLMRYRESGNQLGEGVTKSSEIARTPGPALSWFSAPLWVVRLRMGVEECRGEGIGAGNNALRR